VIVLDQRTDVTPLGERRENLQDLLDHGRADQQ
jgi:hypothetical protein